MAGQEAITAQYNRVAPWYRALSPLFLINPLMQRKAVETMALRPGDAALEVGVGSGRNLPYLLDALGPDGAVTGVDLSPGMLAEARKLVDRRGATNVDLIEASAAAVDYDRDFDAVLFSLSYSAMPADVRPPALDRAWAHLRPILAPIARLGKVSISPALLDIYFVYTVVKPSRSGSGD